VLQQRVSNLSVALIIACFAFTQTIQAQSPETAPSEESSSTPAEQPGARANTERTGNRANARKRRGEAVDPESSPPDDVELEEVVVTGEYIEGSGGRRRSAASRDQLDLADETSMEDFFDDIDGLSTLGGDDQGNAFSIDGLSPDLSNVTLNGQGFGQGKGSGGFGAGDLPPDMIRRVDLFKIPTASLEEGGSGGSVNLQLRNPVDIATPTSSFKGRLGYVPDKGNYDPSASVFIGRPSENKKYGYMFSLTLTDRTREYGFQDVSNWLLRDFDNGSGYMPAQVRNSNVKDQQQSAFAGLTLGFRPRRSLDIAASLFYYQKQRDSLTHALQHRVERQRNITALAFDERIVTELESSDRNRENLRIVGSTREDLIDSLILGANFNWRRSRWLVHGALGYKVDNNESDSPSQSAVFEANSDIGYQVNGDGSLSMSYGDGFPPIQQFATGRVNLNERITEDTSGNASVDVTRQLRNSFVNRIRFGLKIRDMVRTRHGSTARFNQDEDLTLEDFFSGQYQRTPWDTVAWPSSDMGAVNDVVQDSDLDWRANLFNDYDIDRQTNAAYLQADFRTSQDRRRFLVGNVGVRVVGTDSRIEGYQDTGDAIEPVLVKTSYTDVLPSATMRMRLAERAALTLGAAKVMTHPSFNDLAPGVRLNYSDKTARAGNPYLEPFRASQVLAELTWAPERGRRFTGNIAYRDVESYFALGEETLEISDDMFLVTRPINGEDGYILTMGLKLEQNLRRVTQKLRNFTLSLSYTHNESSTEMRDPITGKKLPMPNTAEQVARLNLNYSRNVFAGRLSYQWRGKSLKASVSESGLSVWNQGVGSLNLNLGWKLSGNLQFSLDARNLLDEEQVRTTDRDTQLWRITERDRSLSATLRGKW